jgi:DNA processing protein
VAHEEALNAGGKTIAVMGSGFYHIFPKENKDIYERIINEGGLVITEYDADTKALPQNFPKRNRIISGISSGVLVVEAAINSGSCITARLAKEQNKKVFAFPRKIRFNIWNWRK